MSEPAAVISIFGLAHAASGPHAAGQMNPSPRAFALIAAWYTPATDAIRTIEAEFAQHRESRHGIVRYGADSRHKPERDRQIVVAAFLGRSAGARLMVMRRAGNARPDATSAARTRSLASENGFVGQADDVEGGQAGRDLHLDIDGARLDTLERDGGDPLDHAQPVSAAIKRSPERFYAQSQPTDSRRAL